MLDSQEVSEEVEVRVPVELDGKPSQLREPLVQILEGLDRDRLLFLPERGLLRPDVKNLQEGLVLDHCLEPRVTDQVVGHVEHFEPVGAF